MIQSNQPVFTCVKCGFPVIIPTAWLNGMPVCRLCMENEPKDLKTIYKNEPVDEGAETEMSKAKRISIRRDRRKAKQSKWKRPGRSNPKKVGHGGSGMKTR